MNKSKKDIVALLAGTFMATGAGGISATELSDNFVLEEIIITPEHRPENSQDVAISITVFSGDQVAENFKVSSEISAQIPNVQIESAQGFGTPRVGVRGIAQNDFNGNANTPIMLYMDGVPLNSPVSQGSPLWDLERVEVLRGPQGTLYGRNATAGAIQFISASPTEELEGFSEISVGRFGQLKFDGAISGEIVEGLSARLSYVNNSSDGYINDTNLNKDLGEVEYEGVRGLLDWDVTDNLTLRAKAQYFEADQHVMVWKSSPDIAQGDGFGPAPDPLVNGWSSVAALQENFGFQNRGEADDFYTSEQGLETFEDIEHGIYSIEANWDFDSVILTSITGYLHVEQEWLTDTDSTPALMLHEFYLYEAQQTSQEFRLASNTGSPLQWLAGVFWMNEEFATNVNFDATSWMGNVSYGFPNADTVMYTRGVQQELDTYAVFFHTTYEFLDVLTATAAVRYTNEDKDIDYRFRSFWDFPTDNPRTSRQGVDFVAAVKSRDLGTLLSAAPAPESLSESWSEVTWRFALDYKLNEDLLLFTSVSKGFKGGSFKPTANSSSELVVVDPETVVAYDLGIKSDWLGGRARLNATVFFYDYKNYQTNQFDPETASQILSNMPEAEITGAEIELKLRPIHNLFVSFGVGYVDSEITKSNPVALEGNELPYAEDLNVNGLISYGIETSFGIFTPQVSFTKRGEYFSFKENVVKIGGYSVANFRLGYEPGDGGIYVALWVNNMGDNRETIANDDNSEFFGTNVAHVNAPRTYGLNVGVKF